LGIKTITTNKNQQRKKLVWETAAATLGINKIKNNRNVIIRDNEIFTYAFIFSFLSNSHTSLISGPLSINLGLAPPQRQLNTRGIVI